MDNNPWASFIIIYNIRVLLSNKTAEPNNHLKAESTIGGGHSRNTKPGIPESPKPGNDFKKSEIPYSQKLIHI